MVLIFTFLFILQAYEGRSSAEHFRSHRQLTGQQFLAVSVLNLFRVLFRVRGRVREVPQQARHETQKDLPPQGPRANEHVVLKICSRLGYLSLVWKMGRRRRKLNIVLKLRVLAYKYIYVPILYIGIMQAMVTPVNDDCWLCYRTRL